MPGPPTQARILVVDDEEAIRDLIMAILTAAGYQVASAGDGRAALQQLAEAAFDLVITDLVMPEQEGIETIQVLRQEFPALKIIAVSGAFGGEYLRIARMLGADSTLPKPFDSSSLLSVVRQALEEV